MVDNTEQGRAAPSGGPRPKPVAGGDPAAAKAQATQQKVSGLELVRFRNYFYRDGYRKSMSALILSLIVNVVLLGLVIFQFLNKPAPVYFGRMKKIVSRLIIQMI